MAKGGEDVKLGQVSQVRFVWGDWIGTHSSHDGLGHGDDMVMLPDRKMMHGFWKG